MTSFSADSFLFWLVANQRLKAWYHDSTMLENAFAARLLTHETGTHHFFNEPTCTTVYIEARFFFDSAHVPLTRFLAVLLLRSSYRQRSRRRWAVRAPFKDYSVPDISRKLHDYNTSNARCAPSSVLPDSWSHLGRRLRQRGVGSTWAAPPWPGLDLLSRAAPSIGWSMETLSIAARWCYDVISTSAAAM